jgi:hypothetical protein
MTTEGFRDDEIQHNNKNISNPVITDSDVLVDSMLLTPEQRTLAILPRFPGFQRMLDIPALHFVCSKDLGIQSSHCVLSLESNSN